MNVTLSPERSEGAARDRLQLDIAGMTCASCAARVEQRLNRLDGVERERQLRHRGRDGRFRLRQGDPGGARRRRRGGRLRRRARGRGAELRTASAWACAWRSAARRSRCRSLRSAMVSALQFDGWEWVALALTTPVVLWAGWPFHRATLRQRPPRRGDDGHADLARDARGARVVDRRARRRRRRAHVLRGRAR